MEKAIAAFQALIEFNCFSPKSLEEEHSLTSFFETFWDSEVPRQSKQGRFEAGQVSMSSCQLAV